MTVNVRVMEHVIRRAPFGLRFWDFARATDQVLGLEIRLNRKGRDTGWIRAVAHSSGIYSATGVPGLAAFEDMDTPWSGGLKRYRVEVRDPQGRFLPMAFDADLPASQLLRQFTTLTPPPFSPSDLIGSPAAIAIEGVPLFSAPARMIPEPTAIIRAQLRELGSDRPAAWCLVTAAVAGMVRGIGLSDRNGQLAIVFPYPEAPRRVIGSPPQAAADPSWSVDLQGYYLPSSVVPDIGNLERVVRQIGAPRPLYRSVQSPPQPLGPQQLNYQMPLTVRGVEASGAPSSYVHVGTA